jgi:AAA domain
MPEQQTNIGGFTTTIGPDTQLAADPFGGLTGGVKAAEIIPGKTKNYALAIVGKQKSGKSWFATSDNVDKSVWVADFDNRAESISGKSNVYVKSFIDISQQSPEAIVNLEQDLELFKYRKNVKNLPTPDVFVLDSITYMKKALENEIIRSMSKSKGDQNFARQIGTGSRKVLIAQGWDMINAVRGYLEYFIAEFRLLGNLICVFHERPEKDQMHSTKDNTVFTGQYSVDPFYLNSLLSVFSEVMRITVDGYGKYTVNTTSNNEFNGATTWKVDAKEEPNISGMLKKHFEHLKKGTKPIR